MTFEEVIREAAPKRSDGTPFPVKAPHGWVHLSEAVTRIAAGTLNPPWSDMPTFYPSIVELFQGGKDLSDDDLQFRYNLAEEFCKVCFEANLITGFRRVGGSGPVESLDPDWWELENPLLPFRSWGYDPEDPANPTPPHWIWVERTSLEEQQRVAAGYGETKLFWEAGQMISVRDALDILERFIDDQKGPPAPLDAPPGARELKALCEAGKVGGIAGYMVRSIRADVRGLNGIDCAGRNNWPIPPQVWAGLPLSPIQNWAAGEFVSKPDKRNTFRLKRVLIDRHALLKHLASIGRLWLAQWRIQGTEEIIAEGYVLPDVEPPQADPVPEGIEPFPDDDVAADDERTGDPGRPEKGASLYMAEFRRRASEGLVEEKLADEAKALLDWFTEAHPTRQPPTVGTIENRIRTPHRQYRTSLAK